jgi:hypothetical protein
LPIRQFGNQFCDLIPPQPNNEGIQRKENKGLARAGGMDHFMVRAFLIFACSGCVLDKILHIAPLAMLIMISGLGFLIRNRAVTSK